MKEKLTAAGSVLAAVLASSCCWGPLLLAGLGASGVGFASALATYRSYGKQTMASEKTTPQWNDPERQIVFVVSGMT